MPGLAQREDALLGPGLLLVAPGAADGAVSLELVQPLAQGDGLHDARVFVGSVRERGHALGNRCVVGLDLEVEIELAGHAVAKLDHLPELPGGVDVHDLEGNGSGVKGLAGEVKKDAGVLADGVEEHGPTERPGHLAVDVDRLGLQGVEDVIVGDRLRGGRSHGEPFGARGGSHSRYPDEGSRIGAGCRPRPRS